MVSPVCGAYTKNTVKTTLLQSFWWSFTSNTLSTHFSANKTPTPLLPSLLLIKKQLYLESLPSIILADAPLYLHSCIQHKSFLLLEIVSATSLDLLLNVPTFGLAVLNAFVLFTLWNFTCWQFGSTTTI